MKIILEEWNNLKQTKREITLDELKILIKQAKKEQKEYGEPNIKCYAIDKIIKDKIYIYKESLNAWDY